MSLIKDLISTALFGRKLTTSQRKRVCVVCEKPANTFKDALSKKEYEISGLCQKCQDEVFSSNE